MALHQLDDRLHEGVLGILAPSDVEMHAVVGLRAVTVGDRPADDPVRSELRRRLRDEGHADAGVHERKQRGDLAGVLHDARVARGGDEHAEQQVMEVARAARRVHEQRLVVEVAQEDGATELREPRALREGQHQTLRQHRRRLHAWPVAHGTQQADVDRPTLELIHLVDRHRLLQDELEARQLLGRRPKQLGEHAVRGDRRVAHRESARRPLADRANVGGRLRREVDELPSTRQQRAPRLRERDPAARAHEQLRVELALELLDLTTDGRLRHPEPLGSRPEVQFLGDGDEALKLDQGKHQFTPNIDSSTL
ncbi:hypothetical protein PSCLAVI8L_230020 [Pseudoclavibacter sp. 8L]|nr:hypothetical protein PSCLAVI8L_230020 [Pseudoclavibacter sp. 8L]